MAADGDVECRVLSRYTGTVVAAHCHHEWNQTRCSGDDRVQSEFFDWVTGGDDYLCESKLWNHDRIHTEALDEKRTSEDGDVKRVLVKFSNAHDWNTELNQQSCVRDARRKWKLVALSTVGCGGSPSSRPRLRP